MYRALAVVPLLFLSPQLLAHKSSDSYLLLRVHDDDIEGRWDIALRDLDFAIGLDRDLDGDLDWGEVKAKHEEIAAYALARLALSLDDAPCTTRVLEHKVVDHSDGAYAVLYFTAACSSPGQSLAVEYSLLFDLDPQHKGLLNLEHEGQSRTGIFSRSAPAQRFLLLAPSRWRQFTAYLREGVWHIWNGLDHLLFLISLLLPAVLTWHEQTWRPATRFRTAFWEVLKIVTSFTLAHSITLALATFGVIAIPARLTESLIAASVVVAALNNIVPLVHGRIWMVAFGFGLIHGFGFANVLADLGLPHRTLLLSLVAFNLGVEVGQIAIVAAFLPAAFAVRGTSFYRRFVLVAGSACIAVIAATWFIERAFPVKVLPF